MNWWKSLKGKVKVGEPLFRHTSLRIGGKASLWFEPYDKQDLMDCLSRLKKRGIAYFIIGNGTNLLVKDSGFDGVVIRLSSEFFNNIELYKNVISVGAGINLARLLKFASLNNICGYEFLTGIPGTVGGAVVMNAGVSIGGRRYNIAELVESVDVLDKQGRSFSLRRPDLKFNYRKSNLSKYVVFNVKLKLSKENKLAFNGESDILSWRRKRLDFSYPNAGSVFKNPSRKLAAGALIEQCGLKGLRCGGAVVSSKHANFILNFQGDL